MLNLVSIITPLYNSSDYIEETIQSVLAQTYSCWEMIVVDDCSKDKSLAIVKSYIQKDSRIKIIQLEKNSGAAVARNAAIESATGRFIAFLDSDDLWHPKKLENQIAFMLDNDVAFSYTAYEKIDENGCVFEKIGIPQKINYRGLLKTCVIGCLTAIYDTNKFGKVYMPLTTKREDFATWLNILKQVDYAYGEPEILAQYRVYANQSSSEKIKMASENWRLYRDIEKINLLRASYYFSHYAVRGILRAKFPNLARMLGVLG